MVYILVLTVLIEGNLYTEVTNMPSKTICQNVLLEMPKVVEKRATKLQKVVKFSAKCYQLKTYKRNAI